MARAQSRRTARRGQVRGSRPRKRRCLLKGCGRWFASQDQRRRYCSPGCTAAAAAWSRQRAQEDYRKSPKGRARRREQCRCRRRREKERPRRAQAPVAGGGAACEGHQREEKRGFLCARPGCYERVEANGRTSQRRFCTHRCWRALRTVLDREARWRLRRASAARDGARDDAAAWRMSAGSGCTGRLRGP